VIAVLDPIALAPELDNAALIGWKVAQSNLQGRADNRRHGYP
jgi:hypothetical protein